MDIGNNAHVPETFVRNVMMGRCGVLGWLLRWVSVVVLFALVAVGLPVVGSVAVAGAGAPPVEPPGMPRSLPLPAEPFVAGGAVTCV